MALPKLELRTRFDGGIHIHLLIYGAEEMARVGGSLIKLGFNLVAVLTEELA
jgi:hypothetical protein